MRRVIVLLAAIALLGVAPATAGAYSPVPGAPGVCGKYRTGTAHAYLTDYGRVWAVLGVGFTIRYNAARHWICGWSSTWTHIAELPWRYERTLDSGTECGDLRASGVRFLACAGRVDWVRKRHVVTFRSVDTGRVRRVYLRVAFRAASGYAPDWAITRSAS